jgi:hypothetical protein
MREGFGPRMDHTITMEYAPCHGADADAGYTGESRAPRSELARGGITMKYVMASCVALICMLMSPPTSSAWDGSVVEKDIAWKDLPPPVQEAILREAGEHEIMELEEIRAADLVCYEAEWMVDAREVSIVVAPDGRVLGREVEDRDSDEDDHEEEREESRVED